LKVISRGAPHIVEVEGPKLQISLQPVNAVSAQNSNNMLLKKTASLDNDAISDYKTRGDAEYKKISESFS
jgi:hypothetical protein